VPILYVAAVVSFIVAASTLVAVPMIVFRLIVQGCLFSRLVAGSVKD